MIGFHKNITGYRYLFEDTWYCFVRTRCFWLSKGSGAPNHTPQTRSDLGVDNRLSLELLAHFVAGRVGKPASRGAILACHHSGKNILISHRISKISTFKVYLQLMVGLKCLKWSCVSKNQNVQVGRFDDYVRISVEQP